MMEAGPTVSKVWVALWTVPRAHARWVANRDGRWPPAAASRMWARQRVNAPRPRKDEKGWFHDPTFGSDHRVPSNRM